MQAACLSGSRLLKLTFMESYRATTSIAEEWGQAGAGLGRGCDARGGGCSANDAGCRLDAGKLRLCRGCCHWRRDGRGLLAACCGDWATSWDT
jgi:hypothetical protein